MNKIWIGSAAAITVVLAVFIASQDKPVIDVAQGKYVYEQHCASCHGANLEGEANWQTPLPTGGFPAPPHDKTGHTWHHADTLLLQIITDGGQSIAPPGFKSNMPAFKDTLHVEEIEIVLAYIKSTWPEDVRARQETLNR